MRSVCITGTWYGKSCGDGPARGRRYSVSSINQQRRGAEPSRPDHQGQGSGEKATGGGSVPCGGATGREQPSAEASSARQDRRRRRRGRGGRAHFGPKVAQSSGRRADHWRLVTPPAPHTESTRLGAIEAAAATGRTRRRVFTATHRRSDL